MDDNFSNVDDYLFRVHGNIERSGLHITAVFGSATSPSWAYTVGMTERGQPELVTIGLSPESAHAFLDHAYADSLEGVPLELGREHQRSWLTQPDDGIDLHVSFVDVPEMLWRPPSSLVATLHTYYASRRGFPYEPSVCQLIWPDHAGLLPWESGFDESMRIYQPLLDEEPWLPPIDDDDGDCCSCCSMWEPPNRANRRAAARHRSRRRR
jgi:hypothetical protein